MAEIKSIADLGAEIDSLHTIDALLSALAARACEDEMSDIIRICDVARERLNVVTNNLDLIDMRMRKEAQHG
jgi:hypothetical protein